MAFRARPTAVLRWSTTVNMIEDPVCVAPITFEDQTWVCRYHGHLYYFCSLHCKQEFDQDPEAYFAVALAPPIQPVVRE